MSSIRQPSRSSRPISFRIERSSTAELSSATFAAIIALCDAAFEEETGPYFGAIGPGEHLIGWEDGELVAHLMWVARWLQPQGMEPISTAYVEMVATTAAARGRGYATRLLEAARPLFDGFELAALSPATENLYLRLGWSYWRGSLSSRQHGALTATPEDRVMILRLPGTPAALNVDTPLSVEWRQGEVW